MFNEKAKDFSSFLGAVVGYPYNDGKKGGESDDLYSTT